MAPSAPSLKVPTPRGRADSSPPCSCSPWPVAATTPGDGGDTVGDDPSATDRVGHHGEHGRHGADRGACHRDHGGRPDLRARRPGLEARLLTPDEMAGANEETVWKAAATGPEDGETTGTCQRFDFGSLGASEALVRRFTSNQDTVEATQVVAEFADAKSAWRAHQVLKKWRSTCADQIDAADVSVGDLQTPCPSA